MNGRRTLWTPWVQRLCVAGTVGATAAVAALLLVIVSPLRAAPTLATAPTPGATDTSSLATRGPGGSAEGIKVHGDWLIEVFNRNGTLATQRAFKNALTTNGASLLSRLGARSNSVGRWIVTVGDGSVGALCEVSVGSVVTVPAMCASVEPGTGGIGPIASSYAEHSTLAISVPQTGPNAGKFVLKGSVAIARNGKISHVGTFNRVCAATSAPATPCSTGTLESFTAKTLNPDVSVTAGQQVAVTVVISFS